MQSSQIGNFQMGCTLLVRAHVENGGQGSWGTWYIDSSPMFIRNVDFVVMLVKKWKKRTGQREVHIQTIEIFELMPCQKNYICVSFQTAKESLPILKYKMGLILLILRDFLIDYMG